MNVLLRLGRTVPLALFLCLDGCTSGVLDPKGPIGRAEQVILFDATVIMLAVVLPVILSTVIFAWWFRVGNARARRLPNWSYSGRIEFVVWSIPALVVLFLGGVAWIGSHDLDPKASLQVAAPPITVEVISLDWKWLFIYPDQRIATVNRLVIPAGVPVRFRLTSAGVMNSFFVPQLGSQIYTMAGMATQLNLQADSPGNFRGLSAQFSGDGFSDMQFEVAALTPQGFDDWIAQVRAHGDLLDPAQYAQLIRQSHRDAPRTFGAVSAGLFEAIVANPGAALPIAQAGRSLPAIAH
jgi:cytochrome o ubiquinol oxidase subunit II